MNVKSLATARKDVFRISIAHIREEVGFNARFFYDEEQIKAMADAMVLAGNAEAFPAIIVYKKVVDGQEGIYLADGHRRVRAARIASDKLGRVLEMMMVFDTGKEDERTLGLVTRNEGRSLSNVEKGGVYARLLEMGWTQADIATRAGCSQGQVSNALALYNTPSEFHPLMASRALSDNMVLTTLRTVKDKEEAYRIIRDSLKAAQSAPVDSDTILVVTDDPAQSAPAPTPTHAQAVAQEVRKRTGRTSLPAQVKNLADWIEERSLLDKDDPVFNAIAGTMAYLQGKITLDELKSYVYEPPTPVQAESAQPAPKGRPRGRRRKELAQFMSSYTPVDSTTALDVPVYNGQPIWDIPERAFEVHEQSMSA